MSAPVDVAEVAAPAEVMDETDGEMRVRFPCLAIENFDTRDGRLIEPGEITSGMLPMSVLAQLKSTHGGDEPPAATVVGRLDTLVRRPGPEVVSQRTGQPFPEDTFVWSGEGVISTDVAIDGCNVADFVRRRYLRGTSADLLPREFTLFGEEGFAPDPDNPSRRAVVHSGEIGGVTLVPIAAFSECFVELAEEDTVPDLITTEELPDGLIASAVPMWRAAALGDVVPDIAALTAAADIDTLPPIEWFRNPELPELTPLTIDDDGHCYGHLAGWGSTHIGYPGRNLTPPRSRTGYAEFHVGAAWVRDNGRAAKIPAGNLTTGIGHADLTFDLTAARGHYDNSKAIIAQVCVGEDDHGIWFSGAILPDVDELRLRRFQSCGLSGDWRHNELCAVLAVPVPGFPVPRARVASGEPLALVAAGALRPDDPPGIEALALPNEQIDAIEADKVGTTVSACPPGARIEFYPTGQVTYHYSNGVNGLATTTSAPDVEALTNAVHARLERRRREGELSTEHASLVTELDDTVEVVAALLADVDDTPERVAALLAELDETEAFANWVEKAGGLPPYIKRISKHLRKKGMSESHAIATAVNAAKRMCSSGDLNFPGSQQVNPGSRAEACAAVASWEEKKAHSKTS